MLVDSQVLIGLSTTNRLEVSVMTKPATSTEVVGKETNSISRTVGAVSQPVTAIDDRCTSCGSQPEEKEHHRPGDTDPGRWVIAALAQHVEHFQCADDRDDTPKAQAPDAAQVDRNDNDRDGNQGGDNSRAHWAACAF